MTRTTRTVLHCIPSMGGGGAERQLTYIARGLSDLGWDVHVAYNRDGPNRFRLESSGATLHQLALPVNHDPRLPLRIASLIRRIRPDIVQSWLPQMDIAAGLVARLLNVPWVVSERSSQGSYPPGAKTQARRRLGRAASAIIANSPGGVHYWSNGNSTGRRALLVPNGLPLEDIVSTQPADLSSFGIEAAEQVVIFAGRFSPEKNIPSLIDALEEARQEHPFKALLCGEGPLLRDMRALVDRRQLAAHIILPGYIDDMWGVLARARVFVSVSSYEGHPNGVMEALACGCGLVLSDIGAHRACVTEEVADFVPLNDVAATRQTILKVLRAPRSDADAASVRAQAFAQRWSLAEIGQQYDAIYNSILTARPTPFAVRAS